MEEALILFVGVIPIAVSVLLGVQGLKVFGFVNGDSAPRAAVLLALVFGLGSLGTGVFPDAANYIELGFTYFNGAMVAGLFYEYIAGPVLGAFKNVNVSADELSN